PQDAEAEAERLLPAQAVLARPAEEDRVDHHPFTGHPPLHARTELRHHSRDVGAADVRHRGLDREAAADPEVEVVERRGAYLDPHLPRTRLRLRDPVDADDLGTTMLMESGGAHGRRGWRGRTDRDA